MASVCVIALQFVGCVRRIFAHRVTEYDHEVEAMVAALATQLKLRRVPQVIVSDVRFGPAVMGVFRHLIVLPKCLVDAADDSLVDEELQKSARADARGLQLLRPILAHELLHIRRGDLWTGALQAMVQCMWWFHPVVWMVNRVLSRETERCCDEQVVAELGCSPLEYAQSVFSVIECKHQLKSVPVFPGMKPVEITTQRMERIMSLKQGSRTRMSWWSVVAVLLFAVMVLPGAVTGQDEVREESSPTFLEEDSAAAEIADTGGAIAPISRVADADSEVTADTVVAIVNGRAILADELVGAMRKTLEANSQIPQEERQLILRKQIRSRLNQFVDQEVILQAYANAVSKDKQQVIDLSLEAQFQQLISKIKQNRRVETDEQLNGQLAEEGLSIGLLRESFVRLQKVQGYLSTLIDPATPVAERRERQAEVFNELRAKAEVVTLFDDDETDSSDLSQSAVSQGEGAGRSNGVQSETDLTSTLESTLHYVADSRQLMSGDGIESDAGITGEFTFDGVLNGIIVEGAVKAPGAFPLPKRSTEFRLLDAIALAGGAKDSADDRVVIRRPRAGGSMDVILASLKDTKTNAAHNPVLRPGDVVMVEEGHGRIAAVDIAQRMQEKLDQKVSLTFDDTPLTEAVRTIATTYGVNMILDKRSIDIDGKSKKRHVTLEVRDVSLRTALGLLYEPQDLEFEVQREVIRIFKAAPESPRFEVRVHRVAELVVPNAEAVPDAGDTEPRQPEFAELVELIKTTVEPDTWNDHGGRIAPNEKLLSLVIRQTRDVHDQIVDLLRQLRESQDVQIATEFRIIQFNTPNQMQWLDDNVTFQKRAGSHPWALLPVKIDGVEHLALEGQGKALSSPKITTFVGQEANLDVGGVGDFDLKLMSAAVPLKGDKLLKLSYAASAQSVDRGQLQQVTQIVGNGQTLLLDVTDSTSSQWSLGFPDPRLSKAQQA